MEAGVNADTIEKPKCDAPIVDLRVPDGFVVDLSSNAEIPSATGLHGLARGAEAGERRASRQRHSSQSLIKRFVDVAGAVGGLIVLAPLLVVIACLGSSDLTGTCLLQTRTHGQGRSSFPRPQVPDDVHECGRGACCPTAS